jgi:hypothetical protein
LDKGRPSESSALVKAQSDGNAGASQASTLVSRWRLLILASRDRQLSRTDVAVLGSVLDRMGQTATSWPGLSKISDDIGANRSSAVRAIARLCESGYLVRESGNARKSNTYSMGWSRCESAPRCEVAPSVELASSLGANSHLGVGANLRLGVGANSHPESALRESVSVEPEKEPAKRRAPASRAGGQDSIGDLIALELPAPLTRENWTAYVKHRAGMPKVKRLTATSAAMCLRKLKAWAEQGHDPNDIVSTSVANGWQGLIEPKGPPAKRPAGRIATPSQSEADAINELAAARLKKAQARGAA